MSSSRFWYLFVRIIPGGKPCYHLSSLLHKFNRPSVLEEKTEETSRTDLDSHANMPSSFGSEFVAMKQESAGSVNGVPWA